MDSFDPEQFQNVIEFAQAANGGRGYLRPAVEDNMEKIQSIFKEELSQ